MKDCSLSDKIEKVLQIQIALMDSIYKLQQKVYNLVLKRDWEGAHEGMSEIDGLSEKFKLADRYLVAVINESNLGKSENPNENLDEVIASFSEGEREKLKCLFKTLQEKVFLSKIENDIFNSYSEHARSLCMGVFDAVSQGNSGQTYTRTGARADSDLSNVLVNRVF